MASTSSSTCRRGQLRPYGPAASSHTSRMTPRIGRKWLRTTGPSPSGFRSIAASGASSTTTKVHTNLCQGQSGHSATAPHKNVAQASEMPRIARRRCSPRPTGVGSATRSSHGDALMAEHKHSLKDWAEHRREKKRDSSPEEEKPVDSKLAGAK